MCFPYHKNKANYWSILTVIALGVLLFTGYFPWQIYVFGWLLGPLLSGWNWGGADDNTPSNKPKRKNIEQDIEPRGYILLDDGEIREVR